METTMELPAPGETFEGQWVTVKGKEFYIVEKPMPFYAMHYALGSMPVRLIRSQEFMRMRAEGFPFEEWELMGEIWSATRKSCSVMCAWRIKEDGTCELTGWDKTFTGWVVAVRR